MVNQTRPEFRAESAGEDGILRVARVIRASGRVSAAGPAAG
jgi:hypothetical protein